MSDYMITQEEFDRGIRIKMPKKDLERWLRALESGLYIQSKGRLYSQKEGGFCCLGLEQYINRKCEVELGPNGFAGLPSPEYLTANGIHFARTSTRLAPSSAPDVLQQPSGYLTSGVCWKSVDMLNDGGTSFKEIAKLIRNHAVGY